MSDNPQNDQLSDNSGNPADAKIALDPAITGESRLSLVQISQEAGANESTSAKLARSSDVLFGGMLDGTLESMGVAAKDPATLLKLGASFAMGAGLTVLSARKGKIRYAAHTAGIGLGGMFVKDTYDHGAYAAGVLSDTWNSPSNRAENRARIASSLGPFIADTAIYSAGGIAGVKVAHKPPSFLGSGEPLIQAGERAGSGQSLAKVESASEVKFTMLELIDGPTSLNFRGAEVGLKYRPSGQVVRLPREAPLAQAVESTRGAIGKAEVLKYENGQLSGGSATTVAISADGKLATNKHLVDDAFNITVFDAQGKAHDAHVIAHGPDWRMDLAILQLDNPSSYSAFKPVRNIRTDAVSEGTQIALLGHPEGLNTMHVSRGGFNGELRGQAHLLSCNANVSGGNCGSALVDMSGNLLGIMRGDIGNSARNVVAVPSKYIGELISQRPPVMPNTLKTGRVMTDAVPKPKVTEYLVDDPALARSTVDDIFSTKINQLETDFFHLRARKATLEGPNGPQEITFTTRFEPGTKEVTVKPSAINREPITTEVWPGTDIQMSAAELKLTFASDFSSASLRSVNDPAGLLIRGLELKGQAPSYLSGLKPTNYYESLGRTSTSAATDSKIVQPQVSRLGDYLYGTSSIGTRGLTDLLAR